MSLTPDICRVGLLQLESARSIAENRRQIADNIAMLADRGASLVVLQELHNTLYFCQQENIDVFDLAEPIPGPSTSHLGALAKQHNLTIVASLFEKRAAGIFHNTAVVLDSDGHIEGMYRKMHIPDDPGYYEKYYFTPGDTGFAPIHTAVGKLGVMVCWDQWYPEAARLMALKGAQILIYPTAIGWDPGDTQDEQERQRDAWITVQRGHAIANGIPVVAVNRVGHEDDPGNTTRGIQFWGNSFVCGPQGDIRHQCSTVHPEIAVVELDLSQNDTVRRVWPFFRDRRIDAFGDLTQRYIDDHLPPHR